MPDQREHWEFMRSELDKLPNTLAGPGDADAGVVFHHVHAYDLKEMRDEDLVFHHACRTHASNMTNLQDMLRGTWFDAEREVRGTSYGNADEEVELVFAKRLALWLRDHAAYVARVAAGGDIEPSLVKAGSGRLEVYLEGHRLYAARHHEMVGDYCERMATRLDVRAAELRGKFDKQ
jgi:hypothetical protein